MPPTARLTGLLTLTLLIFAAPLQAQQCLETQITDRPSIGLALGGGGARGFAHIGVIKYLEQMRIPYDYIAGTSMGSIVGGLAAVGMNADELAGVVQQADWPDLFSDNTPREDLPARRKTEDEIGLYGPKFGIGKDSSLLPSGVVAGQKIQFMFESIASQRSHTKNFNDLPIPFRAIATDIVSGEMVVIDNGSMAAAMRASMSVPGVFDPVRTGTQLLVDGGLVRNLPVDVVRDMGADVVIAVDVGTPLMSADAIGDVLSVIEQMSGLAIVANTKDQADSLSDQDVLIRPDLGSEITSASFESLPEAMPLGYAGALAAQEALQKYSLSEEAYDAWRQRIIECANPPGNIRFVRLNNQSRFADEVIESLISTELDAPLNLVQLNNDLRQIYGLGFIRLASYQLVEQDNELGVEITVLQDARGTEFLQTGLTITGNGRGTAISLQAGYLKTDLDEYGSELRGVIQLGDEFGVLGDVYKYFAADRRWAINPFVSASRRDLLVFDEDGLARANAEVEEAGGGFRVGREFGRWGGLFLGLQRYSGNIDVTVGSERPKTYFDAGEWSLNAVYDRLDNLYLPTKGARLQLTYIQSDDWLGADDEFTQLSLDSLVTRTLGPHNFVGALRFNTTLDETAPIYALFTGGGFFNMSGFEPTELVGQHFGVAVLGYRYQVLGSGFLPGYLGMTLEYGNAAEERSDVFGDGILNGSVYFGYETPLGPLYLGYGRSEDRSGVLFLSLGAVLGGQNIGTR